MTRGILTGRELSAAVAEHVMGFAWHVLTLTDNPRECRGLVPPVTHPPTIFRGDFRLWDGDITIQPFNDYDRDVPQYSTDITASMLIVQALTKQLWWKLTSPFDDPDDPALLSERWWAGATKKGFTGWNGRPDFSAGGSSWPEAICRVALLVVDGFEQQYGEPLQKDLVTVL